VLAVGSLQKYEHGAAGRVDAGGWPESPFAPRKVGIRGGTFRGAKRDYGANGCRRARDVCIANCSGQAASEAEAKRSAGV
jgi:hypothetical protein